MEEKRWGYGLFALAATREKALGLSFIVVALFAALVHTGGHCDIGTGY